MKPSGKACPEHGERTKHMLPNQETELKLRLLDPASYDTLASDPILFALSPAGPEDSICDSVYYDTADHRLLSAGLALRVRIEGDGIDRGRVATVKDMGSTSGGLSVRGEWTVPLGGEAVSTESFAGLPVGERLAAAAGPRPLEPLMTTVFRRVSAEIPIDGGLVDFSADKGEIAAGNKHDALCEVEFELKRGSVAGLLKLAASLAERYPLIVEKRSKFERGLLLAGFTPTPVPPPSPVIMIRTFRNVLSDCLIRELDRIPDRQAQFMKKPGDPESAHRLRVSLRRVRALLSFARPALEEARYKDLTRKLHELANDLSYLRELDVLLEAWRAFHREHPELPRQKYGLEALLRSERKKEQARLTAAAASAPATAVLLELWSALLGELWTKRAGADFGRVGGKRLAKWTDRFREDLKAASPRDLEEAHALRILGKKIRYAQGALFQGATAVNGFEMSELKHFQSLTGSLCDAGQNIELLKALVRAHPEPLVREEGGLLADHLRLGRKAQAARLKKELRRVP